jgi:hypothetical protein
MGCSLHAHAERRNYHGNWLKVPHLTPFNWRNYGFYGWLAGVRNHSAMTPMAADRGLPEDASESVAREFYDYWESDAHSVSWVTVAELLAFDYDAPCEDRRARLVVDGNVWVAPVALGPGDGQVQTYRAFLGEDYFRDLEALKAAGAERVVFWFDS